MTSTRDEFIGSQIEIVSSNNKSLVGLKGKVIDETKNTLTIKNGKMKKILKSHVIIKINGKIIEGNKINKRPEDRIKK